MGSYTYYNQFHLSKLSSHQNSLFASSSSEELGLSGTFFKKKGKDTKPTIRTFEDESPWVHIMFEVN